MFLKPQTTAANMTLYGSEKPHILTETCVCLVGRKDSSVREDVAAAYVQNTALRSCRVVFFFSPGKHV